MKFQNSLLTAFVFSLALTAGAVLDAEPVRAQVQKVTAGEVVDQETLKGFVTWATSEFAAITNINEGSRVLQEFRIEGSDWNSGNMYLILLTLQGQVFIHGEDPNLDGRNVVDVIDDNGTRVVADMITADSTDGKLVEWCWVDPNEPNAPRCKDSFALRYWSQVARSSFVVVGGYYQDLSAAGDPLPEIPLPAISAADVVDSLSLQLFVEGSVAWFDSLFDQVGFERANEWKQVLREEGGHFRSGAIYLFMFTTEGYVIFHGADAWREGLLQINVQDFEGRFIIQEMIEIAQAGGGFIRYYWDDPSIQGDENTGTPKTSYVLSLTNTLPVYQGVEFVIGAGFYGNVSVSDERDLLPPDPGDFQLQPNYPNPFRAQTTIGFTAARPAAIRLNIYDLTGRLVTTLADRTYTSGDHRVHWHAQDQAPGVYFVRMLVEGVPNGIQKVMVR